MIVSCLQRVSAGYLQQLALAEAMTLDEMMRLNARFRREVEQVYLSLFHSSGLAT